MSELMIPARLTGVTTIDPGEVRIIELTLPEQWEVEGRMYPVNDAMRPGNAFLTKSWGQRTEKWRRRMYTRSNTAIESPYRLETIINHTHTNKSDTSIWWQTDDIQTWQETGKTFDIRAEWNDDHSALHIYENSRRCHTTNLQLEPDGEWERMQVLALAFSTGITPFLAYVRYMRRHAFGRSHSQSGAQLTLVASMRHLQQLMAHEELLALERQFPDNFRYHPVLTRSWPEDWSFTTGRVIQATQGSRGEERVDLRPLFAIAPNLQQCHIRFCGNAIARDQLQRGLLQDGIVPSSFRAEAW